MPRHITSPDELKKHGKHEWDVVAIWSAELDFVAGGLRNTIAKELDMGNPDGASGRYHEMLSENFIRSQKAAFYDEYCKRPCDPMRPDLIEKAKRSEFRSASPRKAEVNGWKKLFWLSFVLEGYFFEELIRNGKENNEMLICALIIFIGACLVGFSQGRFFIKKHIEHDSNNLIFKIDGNGTNVRQSSITSFEIWLLFIIGVLMLIASFWYIQHSANEPLYLLSVGIHASILTTVSLALCVYKSHIRKCMLDLMFKAQTMFSIQKHLKSNPQLSDGVAIADDDTFVERYKKELDRQYTAEPTRFNH